MIYASAIVRIARMPDARRARALRRLARARDRARAEANWAAIQGALDGLAGQTSRIIYGDATLDEPLGLINATAETGR